ncbi:MAG: phage portal protein [Clostridia bacterium]|jgi:SPP1 family phage portal protein|nr:phage portal protein [Clostridia bacterium]
MLYIENDKGMNLSLAKYYIDKFKTTELSRLEKLKSYYKNDNKINYRVFEDKTKPNNKISHSFGDYITRTNTAIFLGSPVTYNSESDLTDYMAVLDTAGEEDINIDLATKCSIYGYGVQLLYIGENADIRFVVLDNSQVVLIYSDDISQKLLYAVRFWSTMTVDNIQNDYIEIYSRDSRQLYRNDVLQEEAQNVFSDIPIVVYKNNSEMKGDFEKIISLIDAYDMLESDSINENDYFNNAYLFLNTDTVDIDDIQAMKENRVLYGTNLNPAFILKNSNNTDGDIEKNRLVSDIHKLSFTPDMSDNNFANNVSGVAMKYKLLGTLNNISNKQRKFKIALRERNKLLFDMMYTKSMSVPENVDIIFTLSLPQNSLETSQMINQLRGLVSDETLVSQLSFIQNPSDEVEKANEEAKEKTSQTVGDIYGGEGIEE